MAFYAVYLKEGKLYESKDLPCERPFDALMLLQEEEGKAQEEEVPFHCLGVMDENDKFYWPKKKENSEKEEENWPKTNVSMTTLRGIYPSGEETA